MVDPVRAVVLSDLKGYAAVVTGASKGIGAVIAKSLSSAEASLAVNNSSSEESADRVVDDITPISGIAIAAKNKC
jgi:3-oxoacyl-[acyl-carrier protein] reductase